MDALVSGIPDSALKGRTVFMQFTGKKGIALFVVLISGACIVGFGSGLLVGRQFPAHHFERFGNSSYLLDTSTGKICDPLKVIDKSDNPLDVALSEEHKYNFFDSKPSGPPACER
jgi:hypothetical protein